jgi:voltage-gated potassium channel Kch
VGNVNRAWLWGVLILAPLSLVLGYVGYRSLPNGGLPPTEAMFGTLQLFVMEAPAHQPNAPWMLSVARFTAPLTLAFATVLAVLSLLGEQARRATLLWRGHDHIVILGLADSSAEIVRALRGRDETVVVVESDRNHPALSSVRAQGAVTILGDASQAVILRRARTTRARRIIVTTGDDSRNVQICEQLSAVSAAARMSIQAAIGDESLWVELDRVELEGSGGSTFDFFNPVDREAATLLELLDGEDSSPTTASSLRFEGEGVVAQRVLLRLVRRAVTDDRRPRIHVSAETGDAVIHPLLRREPWLAKAADLVTGKLSDNGSMPTTALVCMPSDALALSTGLSLARSPNLVRIFVSTQRQDGRALLDLKGLSERIRIIPSGTRALDPDLFLQQSATEIMARARHEDYCANEHARGVTSDVNPSLVPWSELPPSLQESNRNFARAVSGVLGRRGARLVPLQGPPVMPTFLSGDDLETLAQGEHDRWMADLMRDGWVWGAGPKDPVHKTHPLLVEWRELSEPEREKDRDAIRAIPRMLARAGYAIKTDSEEDSKISKS